MSDAVAWTDSEIHHTRAAAAERPNGEVAVVAASGYVPDCAAQGALAERGAAPSKDDFRSAIGFLRGEDNPFDIFVAAQSADDDFFCFHAPEIHEEAQAKVRFAIEKYAQPNYRSRPQLHPTRTLLIRGARGAGKTHLLHAIQFRDDGLHELLVRPRYFEKQYPFPEYVLKEIVSTLLGGDGPETPNPLRWAAKQITRRLLVEAVLALGPQEWLQRTARPGGLAILLGRRWGRQRMRQKELVHELNEGDGDQPLASICERHRLEIDTARTIVSEHICRCDQGTRSPVRMRRRLLLAIFEFGLTGTIEPLSSFLECGFAESDGGPARPRAALVDDLMRAIVETLAAAGIPVLLAFDNIERLLAPLGRLDAEIAQSFFSGLAQLIDGVPGILVLLFVEDGLWIQCTQQAIDSFARDRLLLGIRMRDYGHVAEIQLGAPSESAIEAMVRRRMAPLRARMDWSDRLPSLFPFEATELRAIASHSNDVLRAALLRLRDRYDQIVLAESACATVGQIEGPGTQAITPSPDAVAVEQVSQRQVEREVLQPKWDSAVARAVRRLETASHGSLAGELHAGLGRWLDTFADPNSSFGMIKVDGANWTLSRVDSGITFGDHPTFGLLSVGYWHRHSINSERRVGIGLVLATGAGMPRDLAVKLSAVTLRPALIDELVVLLPDRDAGFQPSELPPGTRKVWDEHAAHGPITLGGLPAGDIAWLLAHNEWAIETSGLAQPGWPDGAIRQFLLARTRSLLERLAPMPDREELLGRIT